MHYYAFTSERLLLDDIVSHNRCQTWQTLFRSDDVIANLFPLSWPHSSTHFRIFSWHTHTHTQWSTYLRLRSTPSAHFMSLLGLEYLQLKNDLNHILFSISLDYLCLQGQSGLKFVWVLGFTSGFSLCLTLFVCLL